MKPTIVTTERSVAILCPSGHVVQTVPRSEWASSNTESNAGVSWSPPPEQSRRILTREESREAVRRIRAQNALRALETSVFMQMKRERDGLDDRTTVAWNADLPYNDGVVEVAKMLLRGVDRLGWSS